jgi:hypothetical protein
MPKKKKISIDPDIWEHTRMYVKDQIGIMTRHGSAPNPPLTQEQLDELTYNIAVHPQEIANWKKKAKV